jgi:restriction system protein
VPRKTKPSPAAALLESARSAVAALLRGFKRSDVRRPPSAAAKAGDERIAWREFTKGLEEVFQAQAYQIVQSAGEGPNRSVDIVLRKDHETFLVQCKQWRDAKVGVDAIQALHGVMRSRGAAGGMVVTSGRFGREATALATACNVRLIDGETLQALLGKTRHRKASVDTR